MYRQRERKGSDARTKAAAARGVNSRRASRHLGKIATTCSSCSFVFARLNRCCHAVLRTCSGFPAAFAGGCRPMRSSTNFSSALNRASRSSGESFLPLFGVVEVAASDVADVPSAAVAGSAPKSSPASPNRASSSPNRSSLFELFFFIAAQTEREKHKA